MIYLGLILYYLLYLIVVKFRLGLYIFIHVKIDIEVYLVKNG
jgi:hypothetical protein